MTDTDTIHAHAMIRAMNHAAGHEADIDAAWDADGWFRYARRTTSLKGRMLLRRNAALIGLDTADLIDMGFYDAAWDAA